MYEKVEIYFRPQDNLIPPALTIHKPQDLSLENGALSIRKGRVIFCYPLDLIQRVETTLAEGP